MRITRQTPAAPMQSHPRPRDDPRPRPTPATRGKQGDEHSHIEPMYGSRTFALDARSDPDLLLKCRPRSPSPGRSRCRYLAAQRTDRSVQTWRRNIRALAVESQPVAG